MSNTEQQVEQEIQSKNLNAPRLTPDHISSVIVSEHYFTAAQGDAKAIEDCAFVNGSLNGAAMRPVPKALKLLTFCVLVLKNGFTVTGESAYASPENFDAEIGRKIAFENARNKIWLLEGYLLKEKLHGAAKNQQMNSDGSLEFMKNFAGGYRIVSTDDLTELQISEAHADGRIYIEPNGGLGWVALPWELTTRKEKQLGIEKFLETRIPILDQIYDVCQAIEKCGASPELTDAVTKASALREPITELVNQARELGIGAGIIGVSYSGNGSDPTPDLPEFKNDDVKSFEPSCSSQACVDGSTSPNGHQHNVKLDNAFLVAQLLSNKIISPELRKKAETKMAELLDELI